MIADLTDRLAAIADSAGYPGVTIAVVFETLFPPVAGPVLPLVGAVSAANGRPLPFTVLAATAGSMIGAWTFYGVAAAIGPERLRRFVLDHRRWFRVDESDLLRAEMWFEQRSALTVSLGRCVPVVRSLVSLPAGFRRMPFVRFSVLSALGCTVWNTTVISAGALAGDSLARLVDQVARLEIIFLFVMLLVGALAALRLLRARRRLEAGE